MLLTLPVPCSQIISSLLMQFSLLFHSRNIPADEVFDHDIIKPSIHIKKAQMNRGSCTFLYEEAFLTAFLSIALKYFPQNELKSGKLVSFHSKWQPIAFHGLFKLVQHQEDCHWSQFVHSVRCLNENLVTIYNSLLNVQDKMHTLISRFTGLIEAFSLITISAGEKAVWKLYFKT